MINRKYSGALTVSALAEILVLGLAEVELQPDVSDVHRYSSKSGQYSSKSAYRSLFWGSVTFEP